MNVQKFVYCLTLVLIVILMFVVFINYINSSEESVMTRLPSVSKIAAIPNPVVELGMDKRKFSQHVIGPQLICTRPHDRSVYKAWSSAYIEIKSEKSQCAVREGVSLAENQTRGGSKPMPIFTKLIYWLRSLSDSTGDQCQHVVFVPLYSKYCVEIDIDGELECNYVFKYVDIKLILLCVLGIALYYAAPKLSKSELFHYFSGMSIGTLGSAIILLLIIIRFIPRKSTVVLTFISGSSIFLYFTNWLYFNFNKLSEPYLIYLVGYFALSAFISASYCYYRGPVTNTRALNIIEWLIKLAGVVLIYCGISYRELSMSLVIGFCLANAAYKLNGNLEFINQMRQRLFPPKQRLLTPDEYERQGNEYTLKALQDLKSFCSSPECNTWRVVSKLKSPERFAKFITEDSHLETSELRDYERYTVENDLIDEEDLYDDGSFSENQTSQS